MNPAKPDPLRQIPPPAEVDALLALYNGRRYAEAESQTRALLGQYPDFGFGWQLLGGTLQMQGKDALPAFRQAAELLPGDAEAHYNLGVVLKSAGQLEAAVTSYQRAIQLRPDYAEAHSNLGNTLKELGQADAALASYRRALQINPGSADAHNNLGTALKDLGTAQQDRAQLDAAVASYRHAVALQSGFALAHYNLGNALKELGRLDDAVTSYRQAIKIKPGFAGAHNNLGTALKELGQFEAALASYSKAVTFKPNFALAYYNLGNVQKDLGQFDAALISYRRVAELKPDSAGAHINLGNAFMMIGQYESALASCRRAVEIEPDFAMAHNNLGNVLMVLGQYDSALASYHRALEIDPECDEALLGISRLCMISGEMKKAEETVKKILEVNPNNLEARIQLTSVRKTQAGDENLAALLKMEEDARNGRVLMPYQDAISLHFTLGNCFDDLGDHDRAFLHFIEGCKLKRATFEYDAAQTTKQFDSVIRVFDQATIERLRGGGNLSNVPIFVLGMPRSGTTLTEQIIASHPEVHGAGELDDLLLIALRDVAGTTGFPDNIRALDQANLPKWADEYVACLRQHAPDARHITDKMPNNFWLIGLIHVMLPNAKIIHVNRNPMDTCLSCFTKMFSAVMKQTYDLAELGRYYVDYARLMEHWRKVLPAGAFLDIQYEDIVADQETQARHIIDFCGLEWNDACIDFHKLKRSVGSASMMQVRQPIYKSSVERWRSYEKYLGPLLDALGDLAPKRN